MDSRSIYYRQRFEDLYKICQDRVEGHISHSEESNSRLLGALQELLAQWDDTEQRAVTAAAIATTIIAHYHDITPLLHRDLLWFCGGECLRYLGDDELDRYQQLEERYFESSQENYRELRAQVFGLH